MNSAHLVGSSAWRTAGTACLGSITSAQPLRQWRFCPSSQDLGQIDLRRIHWVIVGGESGPGARPMDKQWVLNIRDQCERAGLPFFFKQWGGVRKNAAGRELDGRTYDELPRREERAVPGRTERWSLAAECNAIAGGVATALIPGREAAQSRKRR